MDGTHSIKIRPVLAGASSRQRQRPRPGDPSIAPAPGDDGRHESWDPDQHRQRNRAHGGLIVDAAGLEALGLSQNDAGAGHDAELGSEARRAYAAKLVHQPAEAVGIEHADIKA